MGVYIKKQMGFSLIEVLVASVILSVTLGLIMYTQMVALNSSKRADLNSMAVVLSNNLVERLRVDDTQQLRDKELTTWQAGLDHYLPHAHGRMQCSEDSCFVQVDWRTKRLHSIKVPFIYHA